MTEETTETVTADAAPVDGDAVETTTETPEAPAENKAGLLGGDDKPNSPQDWPDDWRAKIAGDDEKLGKRLDRFKSPNDIVRSYTELEKKLSEAGKKPTLPENATEEDIAAYRKEAGIPETPDGYLEKLPDGLVIGEADKPMVDSFIADAHARNMDPAAVHSAIDWYYKAQEESGAAVAAQDKEFEAAGADVLRGEWGNEYRANINSINSFLESAPVGEDGVSLKAQLEGARLADGRPLATNPEALRWLLSLANEQNPAGFVSPGAGGSQIASIEDEISSIEKVMKENRSAYNKDEKMQARLRELYEAQEKLGNRAA